MSIDNQDFELKSVRGYKDPKTRVYIGGREKLVGKDWTKRKKQLAERSGGRCEYLTKQSWGYCGSHFQRCSSQADDPHHNTLRSKLRDDRLSELTALCRYHHELVDRQQREAVRTVRRERVSYRMLEQGEA